MKKNIDFTKDVSKEAAKVGNIKSLGDAVGLPDRVDKARIQRYLLKYDKEHPGEIRFHRNAARERLAADNQKFGLVTGSEHRRYLFELPVGIGQWMEATYPLMFREKTHTAWFAKNFPELRIGDKY